jgi:hypothetical protein
LSRSLVGDFRESGQQFGGRQDEDRRAGEVPGVAGDDGIEAAVAGALDLQVIFVV